MMVMAYYCSLRADIFRSSTDTKLKRFFSDAIASVISERAHHNSLRMYVD